MVIWTKGISGIFVLHNHWSNSHQSKYFLCLGEPISNHNHEPHSSEESATEWMLTSAWSGCLPVFCSEHRESTVPSPAVSFTTPSPSFLFQVVLFFLTYFLFVYIQWYTCSPPKNICSKGKKKTQIQVVVALCNSLPTKQLDAPHQPESSPY